MLVVPFRMTLNFQWFKVLCIIRVHCNRTNVYLGMFTAYQMTRQDRHCLWTEFLVTSPLWSFLGNLRQVCVRKIAKYDKESFLNWPSSASFMFTFCLVKQSIQNSLQIKVKMYIQYRVLGFELATLFPVTTKPGLSPLIQKVRINFPSILGFRFYKCCLMFLRQKLVHDWWLFWAPSSD